MSTKLYQMVQILKWRRFSPRQVRNGSDFEMETFQSSPGKICLLPKLHLFKARRKLRPNTEAKEKTMKPFIMEERISFSNKRDKKSCFFNSFFDTMTHKVSIRLDCFRRRNGQVIDSWSQGKSIHVCTPI